MVETAYVLVETHVGRVQDVARELRVLSGVRKADPVTGPYDIIATVNASDLNAVGELISNRIHAIRGVSRTVTCLSVGSF